MKASKNITAAALAAGFMVSLFLGYALLNLALHAIPVGIMEDVAVIAVILAAGYFVANRWFIFTPEDAAAYDAQTAALENLRKCPTCKRYHDVARQEFYPRRPSSTQSAPIRAGVCCQCLSRVRRQSPPQPRFTSKPPLESLWNAFESQHPRNRNRN
jgi:hypothetical protein